MTAAPTRRGFLAGAAAGAALPLLGGAPAPAATTVTEAAGPLQARRPTVRRGRAIAASRDGKRLVVAHDRRGTIAIHATKGSSAPRIVDVGGQPMEVAISPNGRLAAVTTAFSGEPGLAIVDLRSAAVHTRADVGPDPFGVAFTAAGTTLVVSGGEQEGALHVLDARTFAVTARHAVGIVPRAVVTVPGSATAWVALNGEDHLFRVHLRTGRVTRKLRTPWLPDRLALSPDGERILVTHGGPDADRVSEIVIASGRVHQHQAGALPSGVGWSARGRRVVALAGTGEIVVLGRGRKRTRRAVGGEPRGLAIAGERAWTVDNLTGTVKGARL